MARKTRNQRALAARDAFEDLLPQLRNQRISERCADALLDIQHNGGEITPYDLQRLYGHLSTNDQRLLALMADALKAPQSQVAEPATPKPAARAAVPETPVGEIPADGA